MNLIERLAAHRAGQLLNKQRQTPHVCNSLDELRGWLDAANVQWFVNQGVTLADHERLVEQVQAALKGAQRL